MSFGRWCVELDLGEGSPVRSTLPWSGQALARVLIRLHDEPVGYVVAPCADGAVGRDPVERAPGERVEVEETVERIERDPIGMNLRRLPIFAEGRAAADLHLDVLFPLRDTFPRQYAARFSAL